MRIIQNGTLETTSDGVATCIYYMLRSLNDVGINAELFAYQPEKSTKLVGTDVNVYYTRRPIHRRWNKLQYAPQYKSNLLNLGKVDVYHVNGVWLYDSYAMVDVARKQKKPYVIMPHGMLYPQDINKSHKRMKKFFFKIRLLHDLNGAACVLTTCKEEMKHCRALGVKAPIAVIPNAIESRDYPPKKIDGERFVLGYIGRISRRKNIEALIYAWNRLRNVCNKSSFDNAELMIIGGGDSEYLKFLQNEVERLSLNNVTFTGFLTGACKDAALQKIDVLCMPSEFENFGMVVTEGLVRGIPCIATKGAPWEDLEKYHCGWWIEYSQNAIDKAVETAFFTPKNELIKMGRNGIELIHNKYSLEVTAKQLKTMYQWICGEISKPDFIYTGD